MTENTPLSFKNLPKVSGFPKGTMPRFTYFVGGVILLGIVIFSIVIIPAGYVGVYDLFGKVSDQELGPGFMP